MATFVMRVVKEVEVVIEADSVEDAEEQLRAEEAEGGLCMDMSIEMIACYPTEKE